MKWWKRPFVEKPEEHADEERRSDAPEVEPPCRTERLEAELAGHKPGAAGLTVRSTRPKC
jgi:hypothetical protein